MACCILGPPTLSTFPASMCSLRATWADEAIAHKSKTQAEKAKFGAQKGQVSCSRAVHGADFPQDGVELEGEGREQRRCCSVACRGWLVG